MNIPVLIRNGLVGVATFSRTALTAMQPTTLFRTGLRRMSTTEEAISSTELRETLCLCQLRRSGKCEYTAYIAHVDTHQDTDLLYRIP